MVKESKTIRAAIRLEPNEYNHLKELARMSNINSLSEYIRIRLFDEEFSSNIQLTKDPKTSFNCDHDREVMRIVLKTFILVREIATTSLNEEQLMKCAQDASQKLKEWGYE